MPRAATHPGERVLARVVKQADGCWMWDGAKVKGRYGRVIGGGRHGEHRRFLLVHHAVWELLRGPIPERSALRSLCGVDLCVNPDHRELGPRYRKKVA